MVRGTLIVVSRRWGKRDDLRKGGYVDVTVGTAGYCAVSLEGKLECEKPGAPAGAYTRVLAGGGDRSVTLRPAGADWPPGSSGWSA